jgi:hypothetical protein
VIVGGLWSAGKTTLLWRLAQQFHLPDPETLIPVIGINVTSVVIPSMQITPGGEHWRVELLSCDTSDSIWPWRRLHRQHLALDQIDAIIYVMDSADTVKIMPPPEELPFRYVNTVEQCAEWLSEKGGVGNAAGWLPVLVFATKTDLPSAVAPSVIEERLSSVIDRQVIPFHVQACSGVTGAGLEEGIKWVVGEIERAGLAHEDRKALRLKEWGEPDM